MISGWHSDMPEEYKSQIVTGDITDANITTAKIADANITTAKIATANITTALIADANITTAKIADANITSAKIADANITSAKIGNLAVLTANIQDLNVTTLKINDVAVTTGQAADNAIGVGGAYSSDANNSPTSSEVEIGTVTISTNGGFVAVFAKVDFQIDCPANEEALIVVTLRKDTITGTLIDTTNVGWGSVKLSPSSGTSLLGVCVVIGFDSSPASSQTYKVGVREVLGGGSADTTITARRMVAINLKK